jgi:hypothetical protein
LPKSAKPTEPRLGTPARKAGIQSPMPTMLTTVVIGRVAKTKSMTKSSKKSRIGRLRRRSGDCRH